MTTAAIAVALVIAGCTSGGEPTGEATSAGVDTASEEARNAEPSAQAQASEPSVEPRWTRVGLAPEALLSTARITFAGGVLAGTDRLPHMVAGTAAEPGLPDQVRVWTSSDTSDWTTTDVPLHDGATAAVTSSVTDGRTTALIGNTWTAADGLRPFVLRSSDRRTWEEVALPQEGGSPSFRPQGAYLDAGGALVLLGVDGRGMPVAVPAGDGGGPLDLPALAEDQDFGGFGGAAADGDTVVVIAYVHDPGEFSHPVTYRSTDGGKTWTLGDGPTSDVAGINGVVRAGDRWVATGWRWDSGFKVPAAWSSADGRTWSAEDLPGRRELTDRDWAGDADGDLGAPAARGNQVVSVFGDVRDFNSAVVHRDASGTWSVRGRSKDWIAANADAAVARLEDGSTLMARWVRNSGVIGVVSADAGWTTSLDTIGPDNTGLRWNQLSFDGETPILFGHTSDVTVEMSGGRWTSWKDEPRLHRFAFSDEATIAAAKWDPKDSRDLHRIAVASDDSGATALLGEQPTASWDIPSAPDRSDVAGWFRASPDGDWTAAKGLTGPHSESLHGVFWLGDRWIAVGVEHRMAEGEERDIPTAAVWTSSDGVKWTRQEGPFDISSDVDSFASGACRLPGDAGVLVVGETHEFATRRRTPMAWRQAGDRWQRVEQSALGDGAGWIASCAVRGDAAVLHGTHEGRDTLWRTTDGRTFEATALTERWESMEAVHAFASGFAAGGSRGQGAVLWLSGDGREWDAVPVPSNRPLYGAEVSDWNGRLILAGSSAGDPEVWILENPDELLAGSDADS